MFNAEIAMHSPRRNLLASLLCASLAASLACGSARATDMAGYLRMTEDAAPMRQLADAFVARAMAGDGSATTAMLSRALVERSGEVSARRIVDTQILPFFARGRELGRSVTVARTTDAAGQGGFAFYMWLQPGDGSAARPFSVYVVQEQGRAVVANIVPDRLVEGRHR